MVRSPVILTLRSETFAKARLPVSTGWLLADCMEYRGKQDLWTSRQPELLRALREQATIQSVESSNRIEGVTVAAERLRPVVLGTSRPKDRSEEELACYKRTLDWIFSRRFLPEIDSKTILRLHALCQKGAGDAGNYKNRDNEIIEFTARGERFVRFVPTSAVDTPRAIEKLSGAYNDLAVSQSIPPLLVVATTVFDFLCIHPFRDGNGRVSRLLTTLLLERQGFVVGRFISLERLIEESKEEYYQVLKTCSAKWATGENEILPWWNYFLSLLRRAYMDFSDRVTQAVPRPGKSDLVRQAALAKVGPFTLAELKVQLPAVSLALIKKVLAALKADGKLALDGRGSGARWRVR